jgi:hypothetical protein
MPIHTVSVLPKLASRNSNLLQGHLEAQDQHMSHQPIAVLQEEFASLAEEMSLSRELAEAIAKPGNHDPLHLVVVTLFKE